MKYRFLSHILASPLPTYGGQGSVMIEPVKSLQYHPIRIGSLAGRCKAMGVTFKSGKGRQRALYGDRRF